MHNATSDEATLAAATIDTSCRSIPVIFMQLHKNDLTRRAAFL
jgi:hypothetical protein